MVTMTSRLGYLILCFKKGMATCSRGKVRARPAEMMHQAETKANCMMVKVTGFGYTVRIDFEDVFVRAELKYQTRQRTFSHLAYLHGKTELLQTHDEFD